MKITVRLHRLDVVGILERAVRSRLNIPDSWDEGKIEFEVGGERFSVILNFKAQDQAD